MTSPSESGGDLVVTVEGGSEGKHAAVVVLSKVATKTVDGDAVVWIWGGAVRGRQLRDWRQ